MESSRRWASLIEGWPGAHRPTVIRAKTYAMLSLLRALFACMGPLLILKSLGESTLLSPLHSQPGKPRHKACLRSLKAKVAEPRFQAPLSTMLLEQWGKSAGKGCRLELPEWSPNRNFIRIQNPFFISGFGFLISFALCISPNFCERKIGLKGWGRVCFHHAPDCPGGGGLPSGLRSCR